MKRFASILLIVALILSVTVAPVSATEAAGNWSSGTLVSYNAEDPDGDGVLDNTEAYTVTVPAEMRPGTTSKVVLAGTWASDRMVTVNADAEVVLTNSINANNTKNLAVTFDGINQIGSNTAAIEVEEDIAVAGIEKAIFGTWSGTFNYMVDIVDNVNAHSTTTYATAFADNSWETIAYACQNNEVPSTWNVGDVKTTTIGENEVEITIIGKNHDEYTDGSGTAPLTFMTKQIIGTYAMNTWNTNACSWDDSIMRSYLNGDLINSLAFKDSIKAVKKCTNLGGAASNYNAIAVEESADKLFLLSLQEVFGEQPDIYAEEGAQYTYFTNSANRILYNLSGSAATWGLRSPHCRGGGFNGVGSSGDLDGNCADVDNGVVFGFCF